MPMQHSLGILRRCGNTLLTTIAVFVDNAFPMTMASA